MNKNNITFNILVNGNRVSEYRKKGKIYIEGRKGSKYELEIINNSYDTILAVPTVDGLSVMDGNPANYNSSGYILYPRQKTIIKGWRINPEKIREFYFTRKNKSYSSKIGEGIDNLGVIGLATFKRKKSMIFSTDIIEKEYNSSFIGTWQTYEGRNISFDLPQENQSIGTGMGKKQESIVNEVTFKRETNPFSTFSIYYLERKELQKLGIIPKPRKKQVYSPNPFPGQFCREV